jgi:galactose-1-phosphate uridylyltransferase
MAKQKVAEVNKKEDEKRIEHNRNFLTKIAEVEKEYGLRLIAVVDPVNNGAFFGARGRLATMEMPKEEVKEEETKEVV